MICVDNVGEGVSNVTVVYFVHVLFNVMLSLSNIEYDILALYCFKLIIFNVKLFDCLVSHITYCVSFIRRRTTLLTSCLQSVNFILGSYTYDGR